MSRRTIAVVVAGFAAAMISLLSAQPAQAHGFSSTVYVKMTGDPDGRVHTALELEYDLYVVSAADAEKNDPLFQEGQKAFDERDTDGQAAALNKYVDTAIKYVTDRFVVTANTGPCTPKRAGNFTMGQEEGVPYADITLDWDCAGGSDAHEVHSALFPDAEGYVRATKTIVNYQIDGRTGSAALDANQPSFATSQAWYQREFLGLKVGVDLVLLAIVAIVVPLLIVLRRRASKRRTFAA